MNTHTHLHTLLTFGLITEPERDQALAHPQASELGNCTETFEVMGWLLLRHVVKESDWQQRALAPSSTLSEAERTTRAELAAHTQALLDGVAQELNTRHLGSLLDQGLISALEFEKGKEALAHTEHTFSSPAEALLWLTLNEHISGEVLQRKRDALAMAQPGSGERDEAARNTLVEYEEMVAQANKLIRQAHLRATFPGGPWLWLGGLVLVLAGAAWYLFSPPSLPACDSSDSRKTVSSMLFRAQIDARTQNPLAAREPAGMPQVGRIENLGHASAEGVRACVAQIEVRGDKDNYAFTIERRKNEEGKEGVYFIGANEQLMRKRFSQLTPDGHYAPHAEPLGRVALEKAFRDGVDAVSSGSNPALRRQLERALSRNRPPSSNTAPERSREIAEIEPVAPCKALSAGTRYTCRLLIERNDPLLRAIGRASSVVMEGDFTFERESPTHDWQVSENFLRDFTQAIAQGRIALVTGAAGAASSAASGASSTQ
jgi:hypothetical protein